MKARAMILATGLFLSLFTTYEMSGQTNKIKLEENPTQQGKDAVLIVDPDFYSSGITITLNEVCGFLGCIDHTEIKRKWRFPRVPSNGRCPIPTSSFSTGLFIIYTSPNNAPMNSPSAENIRLFVN